MNKLYEYIESLCVARGITVTEMCRQAGVSRGSLSDLKSGRNKTLSANAIYSIADFFGEDANNLLALPTLDFDLPTSSGTSGNANFSPNDISRLAVQCGSDETIMTVASGIESQKKRITDDLRIFCRVDKLDYSDTTDVEQRLERLTMAADILHTFLMLDSENAKKLVERAKELEILSLKK